MARSLINKNLEDPLNDSGNVLWSLVKGEQLEFPVTLSFTTNALVGYQFEAVVVEGANEDGQTVPPITIKPGGVQTTLNIRVPTFRGNWDNAQAYNLEEIVLNNGKYYRLISGIAYTSSVPPPLDTARWVETVTNRVYLQFPSTLASNWANTPGVDTCVYGFFELRVTEPSNSVFRRTWKPVRGMVELQFSPTDIVPG